MLGREPPSQAALAAATQRLGSTVDGKYRLKSVLGIGGMGIVYEAEHLFLGRVVALKMLHPRYADTQQWADRFQQEARAAGSVAHRAIVQAMDAGFVDGTTPYLVMERLSGESLEQRIKRRGGIRVSQAALVLREIMKGLAAAHAKGIIHCDLKPANVFVVDRRVEVGGIKILDFGISRMGHAAIEHTPAGTSQVLGTPQYMAPEQVKGAELSQRTDLYGAGTVIYEALAARPPFEAPDKASLFRAVIGTPVAPLVGKREAVPANLASLVLRLLAKSPDDRPPNAAAVLRLLEDTGLVAEPGLTSAEIPLGPSAKRKGPGVSR
jgi:eukaryotic-like serine/threonine-protein kinase